MWFFGSFVLFFVLCFAFCSLFSLFGLLQLFFFPPILFLVRVDTGFKCPDTKDVRSCLQLNQLCIGETQPLSCSFAAGDITNELVRHFLIESSPKGVKLKGCPNEPYFGRWKPAAPTCPPTAWKKKFGGKVNLRSFSKF